MCMARTTVRKQRSGQGFACEFTVNEHAEVNTSVSKFLLAEMSSSKRCLSSLMCLSSFSCARRGGRTDNRPQVDVLCSSGRLVRGVPLGRVKRRRAIPGAGQASGPASDQCRSGRTLGNAG